MRYIPASGLCGPTAVVNAARCYGKRVKVTGSTQGMDEVGLVAAIRAAGFTATEYRDTSRKHAWNWLHGTLLTGTPVILCVDQWEHWVTAIGTLGKRVVIADPDGTVRNTRENGIHVLGQVALMRRWVKAGQLYGVCVGANS